MRNLFKSSETIRFTAFALMLMILVKVFIIDGFDQYKKPELRQEVEYTAKMGAAQSDIIFKNIATEAKVETPVIQKEIPSFDYSAFMPQPDSIANEEVGSQEPKQAPPIDKKPKTQKHVVISKPQWDGVSKAKIAIIIDDMGMARGYSKAAIELPAPMTLAFLPYASNLDELTKPSLESGHELMVHVPMEAMNSKLNLGPAGLTTKLSRDEFIRRLEEEIFPSFDGYVGINNHMGSRLTQDEQAMNWLMPELKKRGLFFVDSKTIHTSIAADKAHEYGVDYAERDVFLDHNEDLQSVVNALQQLEAVAKRKGFAIAIGHPKKNTIKALQMWMPTMEARGLELVSASQLVKKFAKEPSRKPKTDFIFINELGAIPGRPHSAVLRQVLLPE